MIVDLRTRSAKQIDDVLAMATRPVVVSHTGVRGTCDNHRNLSDDQLRAIAANGGLVGIGFWETAVCGTDAAAIAKAIRYAAGIDRRRPCRARLRLRRRGADAVRRDRHGPDDRGAARRRASRRKTSPR